MFSHLAAYQIIVQRTSYLLCTRQVYLLTSENPASVELDGEVGCYNLLVRAVPMCRETVADVADTSWSYVAQELRSVDSIDGSSMQMILTHRSTKQSSPAVCRSPDKSRPHDKSISVRTLLQQFPTLLPASLSQLSADPAALLDVHRKCVLVVLLPVMFLANVNSRSRW